MPQFQIEGEAEIFESAEDVDVNGEISRYSFVTAEKGAGNVVVLSPVELKDLAEFEGLLFQVDVDEEEDVVILRQVQMFFWPWGDDEEFEDMDSEEQDREMS
ncbi:MAG: hypothetical protein ACK6CT_11535 [Planctomycetia bacterium]|jgi:hypothetical protein